MANLDPRQESIERPGPKGSRVLLVEDQPDHAALILEALETALPEVEFKQVYPGINRLPQDPPDLLLLAQDAPFGKVQELINKFQPFPPVILLSGPGDRWHSAAISNYRVIRVLDKREGTPFLRRLALAVRSALQMASRPDFDAPVEEPYPGMARLHATQHFRSPLAPPKGQAIDTEVFPDAPPLTPDEPEASAPGGVPDSQEFTTTLAQLLLEDIRSQVDTLFPLAELVRCRLPGDRPLLRYAESLVGELSRLQVLTSRLDQVLGTGASPAVRNMGAGQILALRLPAWRALAPEGIEIHSHFESAPGIEVRPEVLGRALDELVTELLLSASRGAEVLLETGTRLEDGPGRSHPGLKPGRYAWISGSIKGRFSGSRPERSSGTFSLDRLLHRTVAAVKNQGGFVYLRQDKDSNLLSGFELYLPDRQLDGHAAAAFGQTAPMRKILVVDDDPALRRLAVQILGGSGFQVHQASSGNEAVRLFRAGARFDLVLLDLNMAGIDGRATFHALRECDPAAPIVLVTGSASKDTLLELFGRGLLGYLPKPFGARQLLDMVKAGIGVN